MASKNITQETLDELLKLSRIEFGEAERAKKEKKILEDLSKILGFFEELQNLDTSGITPVSGGKAGKNEYRNDEQKTDFIPEDAKAEFPETANGYLKVPAILEHKKKK